MSNDVVAARAALSDIYERERQVHAAAVRDAHPWWYVAGIAALLITVGVVDELASGVSYVFCALTFFAIFAESRSKIKLPDAVSWHWAPLLAYAVVTGVCACVYFGGRYLATREGLPVPGIIAGIAMAATYVSYLPLLDAATRKAVGVPS
ncbi:hypothetical protein [Actinoplanes sp. NPDC051859]|uniref:hypothetical protein n=1 Tax=Actinoplanes sp. NPDC051859 TaxID=3363909 RepID=UPI003790EB3C